MNGRRIYIVGYPNRCGGANTECWHTVKLWRRCGLDVTLIPTWEAPDEWRKRLDTIGCKTLELKAEKWTEFMDGETFTRVPERICNVPRGSIVVAFCNTHFLRGAAAFQERDCRIIWVPCMNWLFPLERLHYRHHAPFDRYVFQSNYQRDQLVPQLRKVGYTDSWGRVIHGVFDFEEFRFRPPEHKPGEMFVAGKLTRAAADKYPAGFWRMFERLNCPKGARVMGWNKEVELKCGKPPRWAQVLKEAEETPQEFLSLVHCLMPGFGCTTENWPRVGLEAMAAGVSVIAENKGGWKEMIRHGITGYLCGSPDEMSHYATRLAYEPGERAEVARCARARLERELANPDKIWAAWEKLLDGLT